MLGLPQLLVAKPIQPYLAKGPLKLSGLFHLAEEALFAGVLGTQHSALRVKSSGGLWRDTKAWLLQELGARCQRRPMCGQSGSLAARHCRKEFNPGRNLENRIQARDCQQHAYLLAYIHEFEADSF